MLQNLDRCKLAWGRRGALQAAERGDVLVVVDTLSFSTAVATAIAMGGQIYPCPWDDRAIEQSRLLVDEVAVHRGDVPTRGRFSLSPPTFLHIEAGRSVLLASPNGATCSHYGRQVPYLFVGTLINAQAVAKAVTEIVKQSDTQPGTQPLGVTVLAAGERWRTPSEDGELRFAIEDFLGAGAILSHLPFTRSADATVCEQAFKHSQQDISQLLWECESGRELREKGYPEDVHHSASLDQYDCAAVMRNGFLERF
jgi:2-phosphosulfolactate phosphatase